MKFHQEGMPFIIGSAIFALLANVIHTTFGIFAIAIAGFIAYFFRDPERVIPDGDIEDFVLSPSDGIVIGIAEDVYMEEKVQRISIFLHLWDVHVIRVPHSGKITHKIYKKGTFAHAESEKALNRNENLAIKIEGKITMVCRQVAGLLGRRIICDVETGDTIKAGDRYGIIKFGSRMDLYLPTNVNILVKKGQTMIGGETIIAKIE